MVALELEIIKERCDKLLIPPLFTSFQNNNEVVLQHPPEALGVVCFYYHYSLLEINVFGVFQSIAGIIFITTQIISSLVSGSLIKLAPEFFLTQPW